MARNDKNNNEKMVMMDLDAVGAEITNCREWNNGGVTFTLRCNGFSFYNLSIQSTRDGRRFIAPPSRKGRDGNYYPLYAIYLSDKDTEDLIDSVYDKIDDERSDRRSNRGRR